MSTPLQQELTKATLLAVLGSLVGLWFGHLWLGVSVALGLYVAIQLRYLAALYNWSEHPKQIELPEPGGIWGEVYARLLNLQRRNRKRKKQLASMLAEFQASTEALPDGAVVLSEKGEIAWFNTAAAGLLGLRVPQDVGQRIPNLVRRPAFTEYFSLGDFQNEVEIPAPLNAEVTLSLRIIPYGNNQRLLIVRDVSESKRLETIRRDFVANASHELRTPLTVLRGYLDMMEQEAHGAAAALGPWRAPLAEMRTQAARMEALIADLLKLARLEADVIHARQEILDVPRMLQQVLDETRALSRGQHIFESDIEEGLHLYGRENEALSIFTNLVTNAVQYTPSGGAIRVRWRSDERGAYFAVADNGIGVAEKDIPRLTERFYRVDVGRSRASGGTGLGLSIVKHALENMEGRLNVQSQLGAGSTFTCHFPPHRLRRSRAMAANA